MFEIAFALFTAALGGAAGYLYSEKKARKEIERTRLGRGRIPNLFGAGEGKAQKGV